MLDSRTRLALTLASLPQVGRRRLRVLLSRAGEATVSSARDVANVIRQHGAVLHLKVEDPQIVERAWQEGVRRRAPCDAQPVALVADEQDEAR
jgi:hypothetical protein